MAPLLRGLVRPARRRAAAGGRGATAVEQRLRALSEPEREGFLLDLVRQEAATVLGLAGPEAVDPRRSFQELGLDSLMAVELRNRIGASTGLRLPATLAFDEPTPAAVAKMMWGKLLGKAD